MNSRPFTTHFPFEIQLRYREASEFGEWEPCGLAESIEQARQMVRDNKRDDRKMRREGLAGTRRWQYRIVKTTCEVVK